MKKSFPFYYFIPAQILIVIVEDIVTLVVIMILYKINSIRTFNVQLTISMVRRDKEQDYCINNNLYGMENGVGTVISY